MEEAQDCGSGEGGERSCSELFVSEVEGSSNEMLCIGRFWLGDSLDCGARRGIFGLKPGLICWHSIHELKLMAIEKPIIVRGHSKGKASMSWAWHSMYNVHGNGNASIALTSIATGFHCHWL
jgi:hypothetical protein